VCFNIENDPNLNLYQVIGRGGIVGFENGFIDPGVNFVGAGFGEGGFLGCGPICAGVGYLGGSYLADRLAQDLFRRINKKVFPTLFLP